MFVFLFFSFFSKLMCGAHDNVVASECEPGMTDNVLDLFGVLAVLRFGVSTENVNFYYLFSKLCLLFFLFVLT